MKKFYLKALSVLAVMSSAPLALAAKHAEEAVEGAAKASSADAAFFFSMTVIAAALCIAVGTIGSALGQGNAVAKAMEGIARQPEAAGPIQTNMIIGLAFIESLCIYALVVSLILLFANPFKAIFG